LSAQQTRATLAPPVTSGAQMRASDADRDAAAGLLGAAFAEGRLTAEEHGERLSAAYTAHTVAQLRQLTADLPAAPGTRTPRTARPGMSAEPDLCLLCLLLIVCPPGGIAWWLLARRRSSPGAARAGRPLRQEGPHAQDR
jgi:DUF1707 SHOCT-like domain